jgi:hypothetical protein
VFVLDDLLMDDAHCMREAVLADADLGELRLAVSMPPTRHVQQYNIFIVPGSALAHEPERFG